MDDSILFVALLPAIIVQYIDLALQATWSSFYFNFGFPIFRKSFGPVISAQFDLKSLERKTDDSSFHKIAFRRHEDGRIFFREALFQFKFSFDYLQVMHGVIEETGSDIVITGKTNLMPLAFIPAGLFLLMLGNVFMVIGAILIGMVPIGYAIQVHRYRRIGEYILSRSRLTNS